MAPLAGPVAPMAGPLAPLAGPVAPLVEPVAPLAGPVAPLAGPVAPLAGPVAGPVAPLAGPMALLAGPMWPSPPKCKMQCLGQISIHVQSFRQIRSAVSEEMCSKQTNSKLSICLLRRRDIINSVSPGDWQVAVFACHDLVAARSSAVVRRCSSRNVKTDCQITASTDQHWAASCNSTQTGNTTQYTGRAALNVSVHYHHDINQGNITSTKITDEEVSYFFWLQKRVSTSSSEYIAKSHHHRQQCIHCRVKLSRGQQLSKQLLLTPYCRSYM